MELLPLLAERGLSTGQYGVLGWSMGGYGALLAARESAGRSREGDRRVVAAAAMSRALWGTAEEAAPGAFDGGDDFAAYRVHGGELKTVALRIDCGRDDPFAGAVRALRREVVAEGGLQAGAHTAGHWRRMLPDQLRFLGSRLPLPGADR
ncbi:alpha/beta hydrolase-fold protein [Kribbella sp. DT2]|uniref:alpha/beta hydrolase-fold protein n=1 Tax=Kribbella sp. DT2 TaxID=3393427 RepID=UPI003CF745DB